jgi:hypothetical protein
VTAARGIGAQKGGTGGIGEVFTKGFPADDVLKDSDGIRGTSSVILATIPNGVGHAQCSCRTILRGRASGKIGFRLYDVHEKYIFSMIRQSHLRLLFNASREQYNRIHER